MLQSQKLQNNFMAICTALIIPIMILNLLGIVVSMIWLISLGVWEPIVIGIIFMLVSSFAISIALMPSLLFVIPALSAFEKGRKMLGAFWVSLNMLYTIGLITTWCLSIMAFFMDMSFVNDSSIIPVLIWSYGIALFPWMWLAKKDQQSSGGNEFSLFYTFLAQISYILGMILFLFEATFGTIAVIFGAIMLFGGILAHFVVFGGEIKKLFSKKEVKEAIEILEEAHQKFGSRGFDLVKEYVEKLILSDNKQFIDAIRKGHSARKYVYSMIANVSGDMVESGHYHIYRGVLNPMGPGEDLLKIFDSAMDELVKLGDTDKQNAEKQKEAVRENIQNVG